MINYFLMLFTKEKYIDNKKINSFFKSDIKKTIDEKKINSISSHILKH